MLETISYLCPRLINPVPNTLSNIYQIIYTSHIQHYIHYIPDPISTTYLILYPPNTLNYIHEIPDTVSIQYPNGIHNTSDIKSTINPTLYPPYIQHCINHIPTLYPANIQHYMFRIPYTISAIYLIRNPPNT